LHEWARDHKTIILMEGGDCEQLKWLALILKREPGSPYPWALFHETEVALNRAITCVGIILPEKMYSDETRQYVLSEINRKPGDTTPYNYTIPDLTPWEYDLVSRMMRCSLAR
jgi:hypothetical protein